MKSIIFGVFFQLLILCNLFSQKNDNSFHSTPNIVIILTDDLGYSDLGTYGAQNILTPNIDRMALEGLRFTDFYVSAPICSPSRASLMTGCYAQRIGIPKVIGANANYGIHSNEKILPEILKEIGYTTAIYGKWHLGHSNNTFLPLQNGFDEFLGLPGSNDMGNIMSPQARKLGFSGLPFYEGNKIITTNPNQRQFTTWLTHAAVDYIKRNKNRPFFLLLSHPMPHVPLAVSNKYKRKSERGLYGNVIEEIDWSVGEVLKALKTYNVDKNTWLIFLSDNGPWLIFGDHGGSATPLRGGKKQIFEGGMRVPCIMRWPEKIPAGKINSQLVTVMDILPTVAYLTGGNLPDVKIDGYNIWPIISDQRGSRTPYNAFYYYYENELRAVRSGKWKLHFKYNDTETPDLNNIGILGYRGKTISKKIEKSLYNLETDMSESNNVITKYPKVVRRLDSLANLAREDIGDKLTSKKGTNIRPALTK